MNDNGLSGALTPLQARARHMSLAPYVARVITALDLPDEGYHLDLGCGDGAASLAIARERHDMTIVGVDPSPEAIAIAKSLAQLEGLANANFIQGEISTPPDAMFERASALNVFNTLPDKKAALAAWRKVILPHGRLVVADGFDTQDAGTLGPGAASHDSLAQLARETRWRIIAREDLTHLVAKLQGQHSWAGAVEHRERYSLVVLQ